MVLQSIDYFYLFQTWMGPTLIQISPSEGILDGQKTSMKDIEKFVRNALKNSQTMKKSQTIVPLGIPGSGKSWCCLMMLRSLLDISGYGEQTDLYKQVKASGDIIRPMSSVALSGSMMSTRLVF